MLPRRAHTTLSKSMCLHHSLTHARKKLKAMGGYDSSNAILEQGGGLLSLAPSLRCYACFGLWRNIRAPVSPSLGTLRPHHSSTVPKFYNEAPLVTLELDAYVRVNNRISVLVKSHDRLCYPVGPTVSVLRASGKTWHRHQKSGQR